MNQSELSEISFLNSSVVHNLSDIAIRDTAEKSLEEVVKRNIDILTICDERYPEPLKNIYDPPIILFKRGNIPDLANAVSIVGARKASHYGLNAAKDLAYQLAKAGIPVISGMAKGIDTFAHKGTLNGGGRTIAVLGCGLDISYPYENRGLMEEIMHNGAVLSEYAPGQLPLQKHFLARNRIISGMSRGVVVVEAGERSGSLITAGFALEQGRDVFAVPGNINNPMSMGTNRLIRDGARIVLDVRDILEEICGIENFNVVSFQKTVALDERLKQGGIQLSTEEAVVVRTLEESELHVDVLCERCGLNTATLNSILIMLEMRGLVEQLPGKTFALKF